ncbi:2-iminobutanoate/2-iminopropanoate deaminase-like [Acanthaster planci]|uniref:2-iminobutanoate/2-iminopropanoate deaminase-like n=1 Tax=Acanthaster planci TaxID=133434 RepID=A0A8B7ZCQ8_ACAPL|nr:2-iminobutanoate/2-iminopropanoate deaminase-like [Acanthaster planci]
MAGLVRRIINTPKAPKAIGPYNQAIAVGNTLYLSGQIGIDPTTSKLLNGIEAQTTQTLKNIGAILETQNIDYSNVVKTTVLLADIADYGVVNQIYEKFFTSNYPARAAYQAAALPAGALVEIESIAILGELVNETLPKA